MRGVERQPTRTLDDEAAFDRDGRADAVLLAVLLRHMGTVSARRRIPLTGG
jgi:hypothetical protein